jgi:hypothetical protein
MFNSDILDLDLQDHLTDDGTARLCWTGCRRKMEVAVGLEPTKTLRPAFAGQRLDHFGIAASTLKIQSG